MIISGRQRFTVNEALAPGHMSALVLNKALPVFLCGVINVHVVILLIKYSINADVCIPHWNLAVINGPISRRPGLADCHLVSCPLLMDVQPDIDRFGDDCNRTDQLYEIK